jgi:hypothetical protein
VIVWMMEEVAGCMKRVGGHVTYDVITNKIFLCNKRWHDFARGMLYHTIIKQHFDLNCV